MADRFYVNLPLGLGLVELDGPEAHHLATVLRARPGTPICLFNGDGADYLASVVDVQKRRVLVEVTNQAKPARERLHRLEVAAPLPKGDRGDFLVEKLTELGVTQFVPLRTRRSVVHPTKLDRLERSVIEASKQCGRNVLMTIAPLVEWETYVRSADLPALRLVAHFGGATVPAESADAVVAVGPEGGFTSEEIEAALAAGWSAVSLGPRVLRIETAALVLAARIGS
ncbi:MAG: RsmE family RNA methyltransferase [Gemmataceae bacterium]